MKVRTQRDLAKAVQDVANLNSNEDTEETLLLLGKTQAELHEIVEQVRSMNFQQSLLTELAGLRKAIERIADNQGK